MRTEGSATVELAEIEAGLSYLVAGGEKPYVYTHEPPPGVPARRGDYENSSVRIRDARPIAGELSLDRQGFILRRERTAVRDFYDAAEVARVYYPEIEHMVQKVTGATKVVIFDHTVRNTDPAVQVGRQVREPASRVHNDYTELSGPQRVRDLLDPA